MCDATFRHINLFWDKAYTTSSRQASEQKKFHVWSKERINFIYRAYNHKYSFFPYILTTNTSIQVKGNTLCFVWYPLRDSLLNSKLVKMRDQVKLSATKYGSISWLFFCSCKILHQVFGEIVKKTNNMKKKSWLYKAYKRYSNFSTNKK